ncbi:MAG: hypothetical protein J6N77_05940, partial [Lachnospiraceae bacterium]|nr:hypothetical protein [Lachnospiraceae bacterium]
AAKPWCSYTNGKTQAISGSSIKTATRTESDGRKVFVFLIVYLTGSGSLSLQWVTVKRPF